MAQVLAVISGKGGTDKTSLCAGVASCLAMEGQRVLCVDLDVGLRNLDIALGMSDMAVLPFTSVMRGEYSLQQVSQHPTIENLALLTAPVTEDAETVDTETFGKLLAEARGSYDWILLDAPAGVGSLFRMAIRFADEAMLVTLAGPARSVPLRARRSYCCRSGRSRRALSSTGPFRSCLPACVRQSMM